MPKLTLANINLSDRLPGFYVEGRYYGTKFGQATARARFLAAEHKRTIDVNFVDHMGIEERKLSVMPYQHHSVRQ